MGVTFNPFTEEIDFTGAGTAQSLQAAFTFVTPITGSTVTANTSSAGFAFTSTGGKITIDGTNPASGKFINVNLGTLNLDDLSDVSLSGAASGHVLTFTGTSWVNAAPGAGSTDTETVQDMVFPYITAGSSKVSVNYTDASNFFSFDVVQANIDHDLLLNFTTTEHFTIAQISITSAQISDLTETVEDLIADAHTSSASIQFTYNDTDGSYTFAALPAGIDHDALLNFTTTEHFTIAQISITSSQISDLTETVEDIGAGWLTMGSAKLTGSYNDTDGTYSIDVGTLNLDHLADVSIATALTGQVLTFTTTGWVNASVASGSGISGPLSSIANALAYFNTTTGDTLAASSVILATTTGLYINTTTGKLFFRTSTAAIFSGVANQVDLDAGAEVEITSPIVDIDASTGLAIDGANLNSNWLVNSANEIRFRDTSTRLYSNASNEVTLEATTKVTVGVAGEIVLGDSTLRNAYPQTDGKTQLGTSTNGFAGLLFSGGAAVTAGMNRHSTANTAGNSLTVVSAGATVSATNKAAGDLLLSTGVGTGNSRPANMAMSCPANGTASGTSDQTGVFRVVLNGTATLSSGVASTLVTLTIAAGQTAGGMIIYTVEASNGTDMISASGEVQYSLVLKSATYTSATSVVGTEAQAKSDVTDTIVNTWAFAASSGNLQITSTITGMTASTYFRVTYMVLSNSNQTLSIP